MKKLLLLLLGLTFVQTQIFAQATFTTGGIGVTVSNYGRVRITDGTGAVRQIDRSSLLIAKSSTEVFDYNQNANTVDAAVLVANPAKSDYEIYNRFDNTYDPAFLAPAMDVKLNVYGWNNAAYVIAKFTVKSNETAAFLATIGIEMIAQIEGVYGNELLKYHPTEKIYELSTTKYVGYKILGGTTGIVNCIDWYDGYFVDTSYYKWMTQVFNSDSLLTGPDGGVGFLNMAPKNLNPGDSTAFYVGISFGATRAEMVQNMAAAAVKFPTLGVAKGSKNPVVDFTLEQNFPNPFNPETVIRYTVSEKSPVSLKVFDMIGNELATLVNSEVAAGTHSINFNAGNLASGIYMYRLQTGTTVQTRKMILMK